MPFRGAVLDGIWIALLKPASHWRPSGLALETRAVRAGLVHHSDQGVQYASEDYTTLLKEQGLRISMSRRGNPYDNAQAESFMKTLKYEEVYHYEYVDLGEARARIGHFLE